MVRVRRACRRQWRAAMTARAVHRGKEARSGSHLMTHLTQSAPSKARNLSRINLISVLFTPVSTRVPQCGW